MDQGKYVVAEGVESVDEFDLIRNLGVDEIQGYYIAKSLLGAELEQFINALNEKRQSGTH